MADMVPTSLFLFLLVRCDLCTCSSGFCVVLEEPCAFAGNYMLAHQVNTAQVRAAEYFQEQQMQLGQAIWLFCQSGRRDGHDGVESKVHEKC